MAEARAARDRPLAAQEAFSALTDADLRAFLDGETEALPAYYAQAVRKDLGPLWRWLPEGALHHDANAYLKASRDGRLTVPGGVTEAKTNGRMEETGS